MQYKKLTADQKKIRQWRARRNKLVARLLSENPKMLSYEALAEAERQMRKQAKKN